MRNIEEDEEQPEEGSLIKRYREVKELERAIEFNKRLAKKNVLVRNELQRRWDAPITPVFNSTLESKRETLEKIGSSLNSIGEDIINPTSSPGSTTGSDIFVGVNGVRCRN